MRRGSDPKPVPTPVSRPHILFISTFHTPFIDQDLRFLSERFPVRARIGSGFLQLLKIVVALPSTDIVFCWFASVYAAAAVVMARMLGKRTVIVIGGVDVADEPELGYGLWRSRWKGWLVGRAIRSADHVLPVDESLKRETMLRVAYDGSNVTVVPTGYDPSFWAPLGTKEPMVLTVAIAKDETRFRVKGIDLLIEAARALPAFRFVVIGVDQTLAERFRATANMTVLPGMTQLEILSWYRRAAVYCLPSRREGLPNVVAEAMLCGCIPVATDVGGVRALVGSDGFLVRPNDAAALAAGIAAALEPQAASGRDGRRRVMTMFPPDRRENKLNTILRIPDSVNGGGVHQ